MINIPEHIIPVTPEEQEAIAVKKFQAMAWMLDNPFAKAMHYKLRAMLKQRIRDKVTPITAAHELV